MVYACAYVAAGCEQVWMAGYLKGVSMCVCHSLGKYTAVQSCLVSVLAMFSHAILFSLLPRYLCVLPSICCGFGSYLEPVRSTIHCGFGSYLEPVRSTIHCGFGSYLEPVRSTIHCGFGSYLETPVVWTWFCCMHVYLVDCIDLCAGMFFSWVFSSLTVFPCCQGFLGVCGGFSPECTGPAL